LLLVATGLLLVVGATASWSFRGMLGEAWRGNGIAVPAAPSAAPTNLEPAKSAALSLASPR